MPCRPHLALFPSPRPSLPFRCPARNLKRPSPQPPPTPKPTPLRRSCAGRPLHNHPRRRENRQRASKESGANNAQRDGLPRSGRIVAAPRPANSPPLPSPTVACHVIPKPREESKAPLSPTTPHPRNPPSSVVPAQAGTSTHAHPSKPPHPPSRPQRSPPRRGAAHPEPRRRVEWGGGPRPSNPPPPYPATNIFPSFLRRQEPRHTHIPLTPSPPVAHPTLPGGGPPAPFQPIVLIVPTPAMQ